MNEALERRLTHLLPHKCGREKTKGREDQASLARRDGHPKERLHRKVMKRRTAHELNSREV